MVGPLLAAASRAVTGTVPDGVVVTQATVPGAVGDLPARRYQPATQADALPLILYFHGGGWTTGAAVQYDWICGRLAAELGAVVVSVDYRLAPEHPAPAAADDAVAVTTWALTDGGAILGAPGPVVVAGDSAGGNLSALAAIAVRDQGRDGLAAQLLFYPGVDLTRSFPSIQTLTHEPFLHRTDIDEFLGHYLSSGVAGDDPRVSPWHVADLTGVAPAFVATAEFDPLQDEGEAYAKRLEADGVAVAQVRYPRMPHGFIAISGIAAGARAAADDMIAFARPLIDAAASQE